MPDSFFGQETIAAIATAVAPGQGGIAVVRVSGELAESVGRSVVKISGKQIWESHRVLYGHVMDGKGKERIDEVLILLMKSPRSFTGEDVVEIHCHGGLVAVKRVLERVLLQPGVRRALPGEFSQRAVLNGRLDLTQAESISELIGARSQRAAQLAMAGLDGGIYQTMSSLRGRLLDQLSELEARVDFEDDLPPLDGNHVLEVIQQVRYELLELVKNSERGRLFRNGLRVALIGRPNVGKSSLLNLLSNHERAIVNELPGTTRDLVESDIVLEGVPITLLDTAGIRLTTDVVEQLGIDRSREALAGADVAVLIFDISIGWTNDDQALLESIPAQVPRLIVGNKIDVKSLIGINSCDQLSGTKIDLKMSAKTGEGQQIFTDKLLKLSGVDNVKSLLLALNERQGDLASVAAESLARCQNVAAQELPWDFWTIDLRQAIHSLGEITGEEITDGMLERIFSRFCIGK